MVGAQQGRPRCRTGDFSLTVTVRRRGHKLHRPPVEDIQPQRDMAGIEHHLLRRHDDSIARREDSGPLGLDLV